MSEYKRTVFSDLEISHLSESPAALDCLVRYHEEKANEAKEAGMTEPCEFHARRASIIRNESKRLAEADRKNESTGYADFTFQPVTLHLPDMIDYVQQLADLYPNEHISFDVGYRMACVRIKEYLQSHQYKELKYTNRLVYHSRVSDLLHLVELNRGSIDAHDLQTLDSCVEYLRTHVPQTDEDFKGKHVEQRAADGTLLMEATSQQQGAWVNDFIPQALQVTDSAGRTVEFVRAVKPTTKQPILKADASTKRVIELARMVIQTGDVPDAGVSDEVIDFLEQLSEFSTAVQHAKKVLDSNNTPVGYMSPDEMKVLLNNATSVVTPPGMVDGTQQIPVYVKPQGFTVPEGWKLVPGSTRNLEIWIAAYLDKVNEIRRSARSTESVTWEAASRVVQRVLNVAPNYEKEMKK
jgi:hypothetical protein